MIGKSTQKGAKSLQYRSDTGLPAVYVDTRPGWDAPGAARSPHALDIFEVTYLHFHADVELGLCVRGEGVCYVDGQAQPFAAGDAQIIFPFQAHLSKSVGEPSQWYWLNLDPAAELFACGYTDLAAVSGYLRREMGLCGILSPTAHPELAALVGELIRLRHGLYAPPHPRQRFGAALMRLILLLCEASGPLPKLAIRSDPPLMRVLPALDRIQEDLTRGEATEVQALPPLCAMSPAGFRRVFSRAVGLSPKRYVTACRMRKARQLLLSGGEKIATIGALAGFEDTAAFNRAFKAYHGLSPTAYRERAGGALGADGMNGADGTSPGKP